MEKKIVLCDTNVFIHWFSGNSEVDGILRRQIGIDNIALPSIVYMELLQGMGNKKELARMFKKILDYPIIEINSRISFMARQFIGKYALSHNLQIPDALIGATTIAYNLPLFTYNIKDFMFLPEVQLYKKG